MNNSENKERLILMSIPMVMAEMMKYESNDGLKLPIPESTKNIMTQSAKYVVTSQCMNPNIGLSDAKKLYSDEVLLRTFDEFDSRSEDSEFHRMNRDMFSDNIDSYKVAIESIWDSVVSISIKMIDECKDDLNNIANGRFRID